MPVFDVKKEPNISYHNLLLILYFGFVVFIFIFFFFFLLLIHVCFCFNNRSKDSGAYDLGELDQAFFLYLDGQADHPSSVQDQRRELSLSLSLSMRKIHTNKKYLFFVSFQ